MTILDTLKAARGDRKALLSLASIDTLEQVAGHFNTSMQKAAPKVAQRVFDAQAITIRGTQQTYGSRFKKRYDLTDPNQACQALRWWGTAKESLEWWNICQHDIHAYHETCQRYPQIYRHCVQTLKLTRHRN